MIPLYLENGIAYIWSAEDWYKLRSEHRICAKLIGSITTYPRQNDFPGLPCALSSEEATLLVEKQICELFTLPNLSKTPSESEKLENTKYQERLLEEQKEVLKRKRMEQFSQKIDMIIAGKKKKMLAKGLPDTSLDKEAIINEEINRLPPLSQAHVLLHIPTEHVLNTERMSASVADLKPSVLEGVGVVRYAIFKDLWNKGLYTTDGIKFGVDYLVYPGDPAKFHAMHMIRCISDESIKMSAACLVAFGRLSVSVNKMAVLATLGNNGKINYQTLQWHESVNG